MVQDQSHLHPLNIQTSIKNSKGIHQKKGQEPDNHDSPSNLSSQIPENADKRKEKSGGPQGLGKSKSNSMMDKGLAKFNAIL